MPYKQMPVIALVLALTACGSTNAPLATPIKVIERAILPPVSAHLLLQHQRPEPPQNGSPEQLLQHAVRYGAYAQQLQQQVSAWQDWYRQQSQAQTNRLPEAEKDAP